MLFTLAWWLLDKPLKLLTFFFKYRSEVIIWLSFTHIAQFQQKALLVGFMGKNRVWVNFIYLSFNEWSSMSEIDTNERLIKTHFNKWVFSWVRVQIPSVKFSMERMQWTSIPFNYFNIEGSTWSSRKYNGLDLTRLTNHRRESSVMDSTNF